MPTRVVEMLGQLLDRSHMMDPARFTEEAAAAVEAIGAADLTIYLVDYGQRELIPLRNSGRGTSLDIDGTMAGRVFTSGDLLDVESDEGRRLWVPLIDGADRLGVLEMTMPSLDGDDRLWLHRLGSLLAQLVVSEGQHTDLFELTARRHDMSVAAELQWGQLPPLTFTTRRVAVAGILEPAYEIGGDAFDYSHNDDITALAILDSMGHGLSAVWPASLALATIRHCRRKSSDLATTYHSVNHQIAEEFGGEHFITAQFAELNSLTGELQWLNAGHPAPLLVRQGRVVGQLTCAPSLPIGLGGDVHEIASTRLEPWDRVLFFTDGVVEGHRRGNEPFGVDRLADLLSSATQAGHGPAETMRRLGHAVLDHHRHHLSDDFTMLFLEYRGDGAEIEPAEQGIGLSSQATI